jgi:hypothetical protein
MIFILIEQRSPPDQVEVRGEIVQRRTRGGGEREERDPTK